MNESLPKAKSAHAPEDRERIRRVIMQRNLYGLANDTKWNELIDAMRERKDCRPSYRCKCVDGPPSSWDVEWYYHLPFPMLSVEWLDISYIQEIIVHRLPAHTELIDHSGWILQLLNKIGLDYFKGDKIIRIFGYAPRSIEFFDE